jgi:hypothetical protein
MKATWDADAYLERNDGQRMTAVLFLDIDGVLNSDRYRYTQPIGTLEIDMFDPAAVATLNAITARWQLKVVVSSSWRAMPNLERILRAKGVEAEIIGSTPSRAGPRGQEISLWLAEHSEVTAYVILDDGHDMGDLLGHLVHIDSRQGLQPEDVARVRRVLQRQGCQETNDFPFPPSR